MPYFADNHHHLRYPLADAQARGLYNAQSGAIHALISHFTIEDQPAIVTMPTGSGKTAVLMMLPFALKSMRVLIITPSRLVTGQIAEDFNALQTLRDLGVVPEDLPSPRVHELRERIGELDDWEALREYDVVVSTPNCSSPGYEGIPAPPNDLFDLVIIDEAHHSPAQTWSTLLNSLANCKRALFSATPFRRDRAEIKGKFVYSYPIAKAYADGIFGQLEYVQANPAGAESNDLAVARKAAEVFHGDRNENLNHCIMVRTDQKKKADELALLYQENTDLRLRVVHSGLSNGTVRKVLHALDANELDGVICVNMMGEGFNCPRLKIAAIHSPHKSLEVTLQFIGRFARTNVPGLGAAKFIAVLSDIEVERARLFDEGAVWQEIVPALSYGRIATELHVREVLQEFAPPDGTEDFSDLSLYSLYPRSHVKIYDVTGPVNFQTTPIDLDNGQELCYRAVTEDGHVTVLVGRILGRPKWSSVSV